MNYTKNPNQFTTLMGLTRGYSATGDFKNALKYAALAQPLAPNDANRKFLIEAIEKLKKAQDNLNSIEMEGSAGGGLVKVRASAKGRIIGLEIEPSLLKPEDKQMLEDLITAAFNDARAKADQVASEQMSKMTAGIPLPPGFKLPF